MPIEVVAIGAVVVLAALLTGGGDGGGGGGTVVIVQQQPQPSGCGPAVAFVLLAALLAALVG